MWCLCDGAILTPLTPIAQDAAGVVGGVRVGDEEGAVMGDGDGDEARAIAGAGVVVEATPPSTCVLVRASVRVGVSDTPTIPFSRARTFLGQLGGSAFSSGRLGGRACCCGRGSCSVVGCDCVVVVVAVVVGCCCILLFVIVMSFC